MTILLTRGLSTEVDDEDYAELSKFKWRAAGTPGHWYAARSVNGTTVRMHRLILGAPAGVEIDHIDGDPLNNRRSNLRLCTRAENLRNRRPWGNSRFKGVQFHDVVGRQWQAKIKHNGKSKHLGVYHTPEEAARAYDRAAIEIHGEFARLNFPEQGGAEMA